MITYHILLNNATMNLLQLCDKTYQILMYLMDKVAKMYETWAFV